LQILLFRHGRQAAADALIVAQADAGPGHDTEWERAREFLNEAEELRLPFTGADVIARGITQGRAIGQALKDLEARWVRAGFPKDPASLVRLLDETVRVQ
jgi:poly(A) polymerase